MSAAAPAAAWTGRSGAATRLIASRPWSRLRASRWPLPAWPTALMSSSHAWAASRWGAPTSPGWASGDPRSTHDEGPGDLPGALTLPRPARPRALWHQDVVRLEERQLRLREV